MPRLTLFCEWFFWLAGPNLTNGTLPKLWGSFMLDTIANQCGMEMNTTLPINTRGGGV